MANHQKMAHSESQTKLTWYQLKFNQLLDSLGSSRLETFEILTDVNQVSELLNSLDDRRRGYMVNLSEAFGDL